MARIRKTFFGKKSQEEWGIGGIDGDICKEQNELQTVHLWRQYCFVVSKRWGLRTLVDALLSVLDGHVVLTLDTKHPAASGRS